ncbi:MAG: epoxyqueuosine reductase QueH [Desulfovibrionales bacterium]
MTTNDLRISETGKKKPRLLLHICCGPCALFPVAELLAQGVEVVGLFYNPNIHPLAEYLRRREAAVQAAARLGIKIIFKDDEYDPSTYLRRVVFREENRCFHCYHLRLERTMSVARRGKFDYFSTTLLYSKFQKHEEIAGLARDLAGGGDLRFWYQDFRSGWKQGIERSREWSLYRQQYCGCIYSEFERFGRDLASQS